MQVSFVDNQEHFKIMAELMKDMLLGIQLHASQFFENLTCPIGEPVLLIGNQGVGKNKVIDRLLQLLNVPREYVQLHRDTTGWFDRLILTRKSRLVPV